VLAYSILGIAEHHIEIFRKIMAFNFKEDGAKQLGTTSGYQATNQLLGADGNCLIKRSQSCPIPIDTIV
jgi:hypothetical protein